MSINGNSQADEHTEKIRWPKGMVGIKSAVIGPGTEVSIIVDITPNNQFDDEFGERFLIPKIPGQDGPSNKVRPVVDVCCFQNLELQIPCEAVQC